MTNTLLKKKVCPRCKESLAMSAFAKSKSGKYDSHCKVCKRDAKVLKRLHFKQQCLNYKGGSVCVVCQYDKCIGALEFHHLQPHHKDFTISRTTRFDDKVKKELDKCIVVCANCHREIESEFSKDN